MSQFLQTRDQRKESVGMYGDRKHHISMANHSHSGKQAAEAAEVVPVERRKEVNIGRLQVIRWGEWGGLIPWELDAPLERAIFIRNDWGSDRAFIWLWWVWGWSREP